MASLMKAEKRCCSWDSVQIIQVDAEVENVLLAAGEGTEMYYWCQLVMVTLVSWAGLPGTKIQSAHTISWN